MNIAPEALDEFIAIYKEEFGEEIDRREATEMAHRVLTLYRLLMKKLPDEQISSPSPMQREANGHPPIGFQT
jgi:hypothetical protein